MTFVFDAALLSRRVNPDQSQNQQREQQICEEHQNLWWVSTFKCVDHTLMP